MIVVGILGGYAEWARGRWGGPPTPGRTDLDPSDIRFRPLSEYCDRLPSRVRGRSLNRATIWRWALRGRRDGRVLRTVLIGSGRFTCDAWVVEFMEPGTARPAHRGQGHGLDPAERERIARTLGVRLRSQGPILRTTGT